MSYISVSPQHVEAILSEGEEINLIDVRTPAEYRAGHVASAKLFPLDALQPKTISKQMQKPGTGYDQPLYLICRSGNRAHEAAERLLKAGYRNLALIEGGTEAWERAGLPMQRCGNAISLDRQVQISVGSLVILITVLGFTVHENFLAAAAMIAGGLIMAGITRWCGLARLLALMPWNRKIDCPDQAVA